MESDYKTILKNIQKTWKNSGFRYLFYYTSFAQVLNQQNIQNPDDFIKFYQRSWLLTRFFFQYLFASQHSKDFNTLTSLYDKLSRLCVKNFIHDSDKIDIFTLKEPKKLKRLIHCLVVLNKIYNEEASPENSRKIKKLIKKINNLVPKAEQPKSSDMSKVEHLKPSSTHDDILRFYNYLQGIGFDNAENWRVYCWAENNYIPNETLTNLKTYREFIPEENYQSALSEIKDKASLLYALRKLAAIKLLNNTRLLRLFNHPELAFLINDILTLADERRLAIFVQLDDILTLKNTDGLFDELKCHPNIAELLNSIKSRAMNISLLNELPFADEDEIYDELKTQHMALKTQHMAFSLFKSLPFADLAPSSNELKI